MEIPSGYVLCLIFQFACLLESKLKGIYLLNVIAFKNLKLVELGSSLTGPVISVSELLQI